MHWRFTRPVGSEFGPYVGRGGKAPGEGALSGGAVKGQRGAALRPPGGVEE
jgi:hypothetical protein